MPESFIHSFMHACIYSKISNLQFSLGGGRVVRRRTLPLRWNWRGRNPTGRKKPKLTASARFGKMHFNIPFIKISLGGSSCTVTRSKHRPQTKPNRDKAVRGSLACTICKETTALLNKDTTLLRIRKEKGRSYYYYHDNHICR